MKDKYELLGSQKELIRMKRDEISRVIETAQALNRRLQENIDGMAVELGIEVQDLRKYRLSADSQFFELIPEPAPKKSEAKKG